MKLVTSQLFGDDPRTQLLHRTGISTGKASSSVTQKKNELCNNKPCSLRIFNPAFLHVFDAAPSGLWKRSKCGGVSMPPVKRGFFQLPAC